MAVASGRLVDIAENRRRGACIVKPLASMIRPGSVTRRFFLSPPPPLPRRVGGDHIGVAHHQQQPVGGGVQHEAHLIGERRAATGAIRGKLGLVQLDQVLGLAALAIQSIVEPFRAAARMLVTT